MTKFNLDKLREVAEPRKEKPDFMEKNKVNAIDYWYKKYMALKEIERIPKPELTWEDIQTIDNIVVDMARNTNWPLRGQEVFYTEVLQRFAKLKEEKKK